MEKALQRLHFLQQLGKVDGLGRVIITAGGHGAVAVFSHGVRSQGNNRRVAYAFVGPHFLAGGPAIHDRQIHIQQNQVGPFTANQLQRLGTISGGQHLVIGAGQAPVEHVAIQFVVFYQQDAVTHCAWSLQVIR
jgi:hypothetical protein